MDVYILHEEAFKRQADHRKMVCLRRRALWVPRRTLRNIDITSAAHFSSLYITIFHPTKNKSMHKRIHTHTLQLLHLTDTPTGGGREGIGVAQGWQGTSVMGEVRDHRALQSY